MSQTNGANPYATLRANAMQAENIERVLLAMENQVRAFGMDGLPEIVAEPTAVYRAHMRSAKDKQMRALARIARNAPEGHWLRLLHDYQKATLGLGPAVFFVVGLMPPLVEFANPAKVWKYNGLHVADGRAERREKGKFVGFSVRRRAYALYRIGEPIIKTPASPYRTVYDERKDHTRTTHPPMLGEDKKLARPDCEHCQQAVATSKEKREASRQTRERATVGVDCAGVGGIHWTDGHRHADALRVLTKAVLVDLWRVARGMEARTATPALTTAPAMPSANGAGGQRRFATQQKHAPAPEAV